MNEVLTEPMLKWGAAVFLSYYVIKELLKLINKIFLKKEGDLEDQINYKVNKDDCRSFRTRIGKESDEHRRHITQIKDDIGEIKEGVAYMKGKMG